MAGYKIKYILGLLFATVSLREASAIELYVSANGSDGNPCLSSAPCATVQNAINVGLANNGVFKVNVGPGIFCGANATGPASFSIIGSGSTQTTIKACASQPLVEFRVGALTFSDFVTARIGSLTLYGGGLTGLVSDLWLARYAQVIQADGDINFAAAPFALIAATMHSHYSGLSYGFTFSGSSEYGFWISTQSSIVLGINSTYTVSGSPNFSEAFLSAIDGSFFNQGMGSNFSGGATGRRYSLALNSYVDTEQNTTPLPGSTPGFVSNGSYYYTNAGLSCIGGSAGCPITTAPSGLGSGGNFQIFNGGDQAGVIGLRPGSGASSSGTFHVNLASLLGGALGNGGVCNATPDPAASAWASGANVQAYYSSGNGLSDLWVTWNNNGSPLASGLTYDINYSCQ